MKNLLFFILTDKLGVKSINLWGICTMLTLYLEGLLTSYKGDSLIVTKIFFVTLKQG